MHQNWKEIYDIFANDQMVAVVLPEPKDYLQGLLWRAAHRFGTPVPKTYHNGCRFLYGQRMHGSGNDHDAAADRLAQETGVKLFVPHWVTELGAAISQINYGKEEAAYNRGKAHGKSLLNRLASGDMSVLDFEDHRS